MSSNGEGASKRYFRLASKQFENTSAPQAGTLKSRHPHAGGDKFWPRTDIFALGTLLYCLWHGHLPFPELDEFHEEEEIQGRYRRGEYPLALPEATGIDKIVCKCWHSKCNQMLEVIKDMEALVSG